MLSWLAPQTIEVIGNKKVVRHQGKFIVYVDKTQQSGPWVKKVWSKVPLAGKNVLILGFGCGVVASLLPKEAKITGVEIDPEMISIGEKYFNPRGKIILGDAVNIPRGNFDLILIDIYQGKDFPKKFESPSFLEKLSQTVSSEGRVIFNRLTTKTANFEREKFVDKLEKYFKIQEIVKVDFNTLIICSRR